MASCSSNSTYPTSSHHTRSASFPPKSNPMVQKIEQELKKLRNSEAFSTSEMKTISIGLSGLARLYKCVGDVLNSPLTQQVPLRKYDNQVQPLLKGSTQLLEICGASKQILTTLRQVVANLQSSLVHYSNNGDNEAILASYLSSRKEVIRSAKGVALTLRQLELQAAGSLGVSCHQEGSESASSEVTRVLTCVTIINISVLESLLQFVAAPMSKAKSSKRGILSKLVVSRKCSKAATLPAESRNELSNVDAALHAVFSCAAPPADADTILIVRKRLEVLEVALSGLENEITSISGELSKTRTSLLDIMSV